VITKQQNADTSFELSQTSMVDICYTVHKSIMYKHRHISYENGNRQFTDKACNQAGALYIT